MTEIVDDDSMETAGGRNDDDMIRYRPSASWQLFRSIGRFVARTAAIPRRKRP